MSHPVPSQESSYPEDKVTHYPKSKHKSVAEFHKNQMSTMMNLLKGHHTKSHEKALKTKKK